MTVDPVIRAIGALDDELRSGMYAFIREARRPVTRDEAAAAVGISRKLAAFHLDKLVDAGVLRADYQATSGIRKVGRAPKVYQPVDSDLRVSIPPRQLDLLADILLDAVLAEPDAGNGERETARQVAQRLARERGEIIGAAEREQARPGRLSAERALTRVSAVLARHGLEPDRTGSTCLRLRTCPFHPLAAKAPEMVCRINHAFVTGLIQGLGASSLDAVLDPKAGECCVELHTHT